MKKKDEKLVVAAIIAQKAGVVVTLTEWKKFSERERRAWLAARASLSAPTEELEPNTDPVEDVDYDLRAALAHGSGLVAEQAG